MPIYEYQCEKCNKISSFLVRNVASHKPPACPKCGHPKMSKTLSRFSSASGSKSTGSGEKSDLPDVAGLDEKDPRSMGRMMRKMAEETGEAMPPEMDEMCRRLESGEDPEKIEQEMGDVMGEEGDPAGDSGKSDDTLYDG